MARMSRQVVLRAALAGLLLAAAANTCAAAEGTLAARKKTMLADVLKNLDLTRPELASIKEAQKQGDEAAAAALRDYLRARTSFRHPIDRAKRLEGKGKDLRPDAQKAADDAVKNILIASPNYPPHDFGAKIDWGKNPTKDGEWLWQLHRMSSWHALARGYWNTGDEKYAQAWARQFLDWVRRNLLEARPAYAWRTIEAGIRGHGWINLFQQFVDAEAFSPEVCAAFVAACLEHARYLDAALEKRPDGNNWRLMEAEGLGAIALCFPEFKDAAAWRKRSFSVLKSNIKKQVRGDGMHYEQCFNYHQGCVAWFARTAQLAKMNGYEEGFGEEYFATIEAMCAALLKMSFPDGTMAQFGDGHSHQDIRGTLKEWAGFFKREDFRYAGSGRKEGAPPAEVSCALKESGLYAMRSGWDADAACLVLKCGPDGGWHCQPDNGTFELFAGGRRLMPDSGCYIYSGDAEGRAWFRQTRVHQTLTLGGKDTKYEPRLRLWKPGVELDALVVENAGYEKFTHRRAVLFVKPKLFVLVDEARGEAAGEVRAHFQLAPAEKEAAFDAKAFTARTGFAEGTNLLVAGFPPEGARFEKEEGQVSFNYGKREPRPAFAFVAQKSKATLRFVTVLALHEGAAPRVSVKAAGDAKPGADRVELEVTAGGETVRVGYDLEKGEAWRSKP